ncbi:hypothetical protein DFH28DRAFT_1216997 [Melampsora americana]|nr:hypothetical protein DFH28DRAFT_1216997 [Melampsora americana]
MVINKRNIHQQHSTTIYQPQPQQQQQQQQQSDRRLRLLKNCSKWNSALLLGRRTRGPQWDYSTGSYHINKNSITYLTGVTPIINSTNQPSSSTTTSSSSYITSTSTHLNSNQLIRSSSRSNHPIINPQSHPSQSNPSHPTHSSQSQSNHQSKFNSFNHPTLNLIPQSNLAPHSTSIPTPTPTSHHHHQQQQQQFNLNEQPIESSNYHSTKSSIDQPNSQSRPSHPEPLINPSSAHPYSQSQSRSSSSPQFQSSLQTHHPSYPTHLIPTPTSPDKPIHQTIPSNLEHPTQSSPIPTPTPQDQSTSNFRSSTQWSPNPNPNVLPYTHPLSSQSFPNQTSQPIKPPPTGTLPIPLTKPTSIDPQPSHFQANPNHHPNPTSSTPTSTSRPNFPSQPYSPYLSSSSPSNPSVGLPNPSVGLPNPNVGSPNPSSGLPSPSPTSQAPHPNFKTVASFTNLPHQMSYPTNLQQIQQQQQAQIALKHQQSQAISHQTKGDSYPLPGPSQVYSSSISQPTYSHLGVGYMKNLNGNGRDGFRSSSNGPNGASVGFVGFDPTSSVSEHEGNGHRNEHELEHVRQEDVHHE